MVSHVLFLCLSDCLSHFFSLLSLESLSIRVSTDFEGCFKEVLRIFDEFLKGISKIEDCFEGVLKVIQAYFKGVLWVIQGRHFKEISNVFQQSFKF